MPNLADIGQKWLDLLIPFSFDYRDGFMAGDLEEKTGIPERTASRYLKKLVEAGFLRVRKEGKSNIYWIDLDKSISKILIRTIENYKSLTYREKKFWPLIDELLSFGGLVLFGSYPKDYATQESDIDVLFLGKKSEKIKKIAESYPQKVDLKFATLEEFENLLEEEKTLAMEIIKGHVAFDSPDFLDLCWRYYKNEL